MVFQRARSKHTATFVPTTSGLSASGFPANSPINREKPPRFERDAHDLRHAVAQSKPS